MSVLADERCTVCDRNFPLHGTICHPCSEQSSGHQVPGTRYQVPGYLSEMQFPGVISDAPTHARPGVIPDEPEMHRLEEAHQLGQMEPLPVQLGEMPPHAGRVMRAIAEHMRTRIGLRRAIGDERPLPYATSVAVKAGLAADKPAASKAIRALVRDGVIKYVGTLPPLQPGLNGTKLYAPPGTSDGRSTP